MIAELTNHLWQSTLFAVAAGLLAVAFRKNRAEVRYWLWFSASLKFFVPFALLVSLGSHLNWAPAAKQIAPPSVSFSIEQIAEPFPDVSLPAASSQGTKDWTPAITWTLWGIWLLGFGAIVLMRLNGWRWIRNVLRASSPIEISNREIPASVRVRSCPGLMEPGIVGWLRPILLLPADIMERLTQPQLDAVLAHELCHVRRRDNLTSSIHMIVEAVFWFHPLVWWMSARLVEERERACDEEVLRLGNEPRVYAEGILNVCKVYMESPLRCVSGVTGSDLKKRIQAILSGSVAVELNGGRKMALTLAAVSVLALPLVVGMLNASAVPTQPLQNPTRPSETPKWEVVSIKPCASGIGGRGFGPQSVGRMHLVCPTVIDLIKTAYFTYANGRDNLPVRFPIDGIPAWINASRYEINAKAEGTPNEKMMQGPMLQELLQSRFNLQTHLETREVPVYVLTVAKGGLRLPRFQEGECTPTDLNNLPGRGDDLSNRCHWSAYRKSSNKIVDAQATTLDDFARIFIGNLDRPVINNTGIKGRFDFNLEYAMDEVTVGDSTPPEHTDEPVAPSVFTALEQVGLKLEASKGPWEFLVIDSIERPKENQEVAPAPIGPKHTPLSSITTPLTFEAASIKPTKDHTNTGGYCLGADESPDLHRGAVLGRCRFFNLTVRELIDNAYPHGAGSDGSLIDGPAWATTFDLESSDRYTVEAVVENPSTVTHQQLLQMLQTLLAERFKLRVHTEVRDQPGLVLVIAKGGPKLVEHVEGHATGLQVDFVHQSVTGGTQVSTLARFLSSRAGLDRAVTDKTGLTGIYDFTLTWGGGADNASGPSLTTALQEQLGLRVESQNVRIDAIVIDHVEKPTAN